jgi:hypothetical protein
MTNSVSNTIVSERDEAPPNRIQIPDITRTAWSSRQKFFATTKSGGKQTEMNLDRFDQPLRLAKGSHQPGSGKGCAMNAISYISGDPEITDFPACTARPLAAFVQSCNDLLAGPDGYLSPENSLLALELGWQTVGTADAADTVIHAWVAELLASPTWGVVRYTKNAAVKAIFDIAELHRKAASGDMPPIAAWDAAHRAAHAAARVISPTLDTGGLHAVLAAHQSTAIIDTDHWVELDAVTGHALRAHELVAGDVAATHIVALTRRAIRSWRHLARLANPSEASPRQAELRLDHISGVSAEATS